MGINSLSRSAGYLERMIDFPCSLSKIHFCAREQNKFILGPDHYLTLARAQQYASSLMVSEEMKEAKTLLNKAI